MNVQNNISIKKNSQHIIYYFIIFFKIHISLLDCKKLNP